MDAGLAVVIGATVTSVGGILVSIIGVFGSWDRAKITRERDQAMDELTKVKKERDDALGALQRLGDRGNS